MKRFGVLALIAVLVLGLAVYFAACGGGGGGSSSNTVTYSSPSQAASSSQAVTGAVVLSGTVGSAADTAGSAIPAGYAPALRAKAVDTSAIANIDPRLKTVVDKMVADLKSTTITGSLAKARSLKTANLAPSLTSTINVSNPCAGGGSYTISGTDSSTGTYSEHTVSVVYNSCQDSATYPYVVLSGSLSAYDKHLFDGSSDTANVTATSLSLTTHENSTISATDTLNGTFNKTENVTSNATGTVTSGQGSVNGTFTVADSSGTGTFSITNFSDISTLTTTTTSTTDEHTFNGSFSLALSGGGNTFTFTLALSNLDDKIATYAANSSQDEWINGTITMTWSPDLGGACIPGTITLTTAAATPIHTPSPSSCPTSGTITVNNATIQFGVPSGSEVTVTVGSTSQIFTDCYSLSGGQCI